MELYVIMNGALARVRYSNEILDDYCAPLRWSLRSRLYPDGRQCTSAQIMGGGPVPGARRHRADGLASEVARPQSKRTFLGHAATQDIRSRSQTKDSQGAHRHTFSVIYLFLVMIH